MPQQFKPDNLAKLTLSLTKRQWEWLHEKSFKSRQSKAEIIRQLISKAMKGGE